MHYLIDGHNLIARMPDISLDDPHDEAKLVLQLRKWTARNRKRRVTVVFDGGLPGGESRGLSSGPVKTVFASTGKTADSVLIRHIRRVPNPSEYTLISNDNEVLREASSRKMPTISAESFALQLQGQRTHTGADLAEQEPELSDEEVAEWLELFDRGQRD